MKVVFSRKKMILFILLFTSVDTILFGTNQNVLFNYIPRVISLLGIVALLPKRRLKKDKTLFACIVMLLIVCLSNYIYSTDFGTTVSRVLVILVAFSIVSSYSIKEFFNIYDTFMYLVSVITIFLYILTLMLPSFVRHLPTITNMANSKFYTCILSSISAESVNRVYIPRASGIFWEAGAFAIYLVTAIFYQLFVSDKIRISRLCVYLITLLLTFSTTGFIATAMLIFTFTFTNKNKGKYNSLIRFVALFLVIMIVGLFFLGSNTVIYQTLFGKIVNQESTALTRYASFIVPFRIVIDFPLLGVSAGRISDFMRSYALQPGLVGVLQASAMCTNTIAYQFGTYGFVMGMIFIFGTWKFTYKFSGNRNIIAIGLFLTFFFAYFGENFFSFFPYLYVFYGFKTINEQVGDFA